MRNSLSCGLVALVAWFLLAGPTPGAVAGEASLSVKEGLSVNLVPDGDTGSVLVLKHQGVPKITLELVALSGAQAKTCATITHGWKKGTSEEGQIVLVYKRQTAEHIIPSLGFNSPAGAGGEGGSVVKVNGKHLCSFRPPAGRALGSKEKQLLEVAIFADKDGEKQFRDSVKDFASFSDAMKTLKSLEDVKTWAAKYPKVTVIVLTVSWLPAE